MPGLIEDATVEAIRIRVKWENDDYLCRGHILNVVREKGLRTDPKTKVDTIAWWIDSGATTHVCKDRCWFKTYEPVEDGYVLYMGDDHFTPVHGKGSVVLEFSSGKSITLFNVLYVSKLRKNLISGLVLNKCGYKQVYESDKYILSKSVVFVGFGYYNNEMFMLNLNKVPDDSGSVYMSSSTVGCRAVVRLSDPKRKTLGEKGIDCIFVGYAEHSKAYRFYVIEPNDFVSINTIIESRDAIFDENHFSSIPRPKDIIPNLDESQRDDHCTYSGKGVIICLYVDDMLIFGTDQNRVDKTKKFLSSKFSMKDMGESDAILVGRLSRFTSNPIKHHWHAITIIYKYLKGTINYGLSYVEYPSVLEGYSDASWINHVEDSSSTSGWVFLLGGGAVSWASKNQTCITGSTIESEFVELAAGKEAEWLRNLIHEILIWPKPIASVSIHCDSAATLTKAYSKIYNEAEFNVESSYLEIGTLVFIFPMCKTKRTTYEHEVLPLQEPWTWLPICSLMDKDTWLVILSSTNNRVL
nr:zinc finger, CCHC-type [Tanacetum cinerariifolium]